MHQLVVLVIPVFVICMALEFGYGWVKGRNTYGLADTLSSLSQGLLSQATAVCTQLFQIGLYTLIFPKVALWPQAALWDRWPGWLLAVVLYDFCDYWLHRVSHESAVFWAGHVVHHQSRHMNLSTALRQESTYALLGWVFYLPLAVVGVPPELVAVVALGVLLYQFWIHTEHIGRLGWFDRVFSSPSNHRVHHAINDRYIDKNYGAILVLWDRLFGTYEPEAELCVYGTREPLNSWNPLWAVGQVYWALFQKARRAPRWGDKLRVWFKAPGWQPTPASGPAATSAALTQVLGPGQASAPQNAVACAVFVALMLVTCVLLWRADDLAYGVALAAATGVAAGLWAVGALLAARLGPLAGAALGAVAVAVGAVLACSAGPGLPDGPIAAAFLPANLGRDILEGFSADSGRA